eukprot:1089883-Rhodomonas_salina.1
MRCRRLTQGLRVADHLEPGREGRPDAALPLDLLRQPRAPRRLLSPAAPALTAPPPPTPCAALTPMACWQLQGGAPDHAKMVYGLDDEDAKSAGAGEHSAEVSAHCCSRGKRRRGAE